jgi:hypothetical protein
MSRDAEPSSYSAPDQASLLEQILRRTLSAEQYAADAIELACVQALREVGRRRRGEPLSLEPVTVELVTAALQTFFDGMTHWQTTVAAVSQTIFDDPVAHDRLSALWDQLAELS